MASNAIRKLSQAYIDKRRELLDADSSRNGDHELWDECMLAAVKELAEILRFSGRIYASTDIEAICFEHERRKDDARTG
jgi:hypothetical protein